MNTGTIREKLHHYIDTVEGKKLKAMYTIFEDEMEEEYSDELKMMLNQRYEAYKKGGKLISEKQAKQRIEKLLRAMEKK